MRQEEEHDDDDDDLDEELDDEAGKMVNDRDVAGMGIQWIWYDEYMDPITNH